MDEVIRDFLAEATENIDALDRSIVRLEETPDDPALLSEIFRVMHSIKGTCGFLGLQRLASVAHAAEDVLGQFRDGVLAPSRNSVSAILEAIDAIKVLLAELEAQGEEPAIDNSGLISRLKAIANGAGNTPTTSSAAEPQQPLSDRLGGLSSIDCAIEMALGKLKSRPEGLRFSSFQEDALHGSLREAAWAVFSGENANAMTAALAALEVNNEDETNALMTSIKEGLSDLGIDEATIEESIAALRPAPQNKPSSEDGVADTRSGDAPASNIAAQTIRVNVEALEQLMNVASELVLIRNQLLQTLRAQPESPFAAPLQRLNHVTTELQESVMTTRMQPISAAWTKLPRLARDLAVELNKRIEVSMQGEDTELDRQVLEMIKDPLTHMIRNAADHGLESPGERARVGKSETGRIQLAARHEGSHIVIEVSDDGRGLNATKIRAKALARGLITPSEAESLSDAKVQQFIFHPGFSTAEAVSAVSGRGVGMDVVRANIEKIGGTVELSSEEGRGTRFTIRIPLTLTIVSALIIDCCGERFAMPQSAVVELVGVGGGSGRAIERVNDAPVLRLRDRLLPLISLQDLMHLPAQETDDDERCVMITRLGSFSFGIIVDRVFDTEEIVVKPAASALRTIPFYSGATILGDGAVIMILDPKGIAAKVGSIDVRQDEENTRKSARREDMEQLLVVRSGMQAPKATPLKLVSRIEEVPLESIEYANGRPVLQYRGRLMPLIGAEGETMFAQSGEIKPVIVFDNNERAIGLVVDEILDIVEAPLSSQFKADRPGVLGSLVIADKVTDVIDLAFFWRLAAGATPEEQEADASQARQALIVDPSPFQRNLVAPLLAMAGFQVSFAEDAITAARIEETQGPFDVVLTDIAFADREALATLSAPVVGLYDDALALRHDAADGFARIACRFDRDELVSSIKDLAQTPHEQERNVA